MRTERQHDIYNACPGDACISSLCCLCIAYAHATVGIPRVGHGIDSGSPRALARIRSDLYRPLRPAPRRAGAAFEPPWGRLRLRDFAATAGPCCAVRTGHHSRVDQARRRWLKREAGGVRENGYDRRSGANRPLFLHRRPRRRHLQGAADRLADAAWRAEPDFRAHRRDAGATLRQQGRNVRRLRPLALEGVPVRSDTRSVRQNELRPVRHHRSALSLAGRREGLVPVFRSVTGVPAGDDRLQ